MGELGSFVRLLIVRLVVASVGIGLCFAVPMGVMAMIYGIDGVEPVQAAQPAPPTVKPCELVNTFGTIEIARCTPDGGAPYLINSHGFMLQEDW